MLSRTFLVATFFPVCALAQATSDPACVESVERPIAFRSASAADRIKVAIGPGACHLAQLTITISSQGGQMLYRYSAPFKKLTAVSWDDPDLPKDARALVLKIAEKGIVPRSEMPSPQLPNKVTDENPFALAVPRRVYDRLLRGGQPVFHHATYYEGGYFLAYDPTVKRTRVIIAWGL